MLSQFAQCTILHSSDSDDDDTTFRIGDPIPYKWLLQCLLRDLAWFRFLIQLAKQTLTDYYLDLPARFSTR